MGLKTVNKPSKFIMQVNILKYVKFFTFIYQFSGVRFIDFVEDIFYDFTIITEKTFYKN